MADTTAQHVAEQWVLQIALPAKCDGLVFSGRKIRLTWGGSFAFDAVSEDGSIIAAISTSAARTATGKAATAKFQKLKTDALYLLHANSAKRRIMVFTEISMLEYFHREVASGRFPPAIELMHIELPSDIQNQVVASRDKASKETSPR